MQRKTVECLPTWGALWFAALVLALLFGLSACASSIPKQWPPTLPMRHEPLETRPLDDGGPR